MINYLIIPISFFLGCIPFALIFVRKASGLDVRVSGTGNIGAMNSYEITNKKSIGIYVFLGDFLKGVAAVLITRLMSNNDIFWASSAAFFVVMGHNFNPFLKFKGGRGLASTAGAFIMINPIVIIFWGLLWVAGMYMIKKDIHVGNIVATIFTTLLIYYTPEKFVAIFNMIPASKLNIILASGAVCLLIFLKHIGPFIDLLKSSLLKKDE